MFKFKIILFILITVFIVPSAYCQEKSENHVIKTIAGTVINVDAAGNIITIRTEDQQQMAFFVSEKVTITQQTHTIGLMDIEQSNPVIIQYYVSTSGKMTVVSIVDNKVISS